MSLKNLLITILFLGLATTVAFGSKLDSLSLVLVKTKASGDQRQLAKVHLKLGRQLSSRSEEKYDRALHHYNKSAEIAQAIGDLNTAAEAMFYSAGCLRRTNNYQKSLEQFYKVVELEADLIDEVIKAKAHSELSTIYQALGNYEDAYQHQMQGLLIFEVKEDSAGIARSHYNIGTIFFYQKQYHESQDSYQKAMDICEALNDNTTIYSCHAALGAVNEKLNNHEESLNHNIRSLEIAEQLNYKTGIAYSKGNIGTNFVNQRNYKKAETYYKEAIALKTELEDVYSAIGNKIEIAQLYLEWGKTRKAQGYLENALKSAESLDLKSRQSDIYKHLALVYDQLNQPLIAYDYHKKYVATKDSLLNEKTLEEMGQSKRRFEIQKSEHEIQLLKKENELLGKNEEIKTQQIYLFAITTIAFLMFLLWKINRLNYQRKMNGLLEEKNKLLKSNSEEIQIKNKQLEESNESLQQFAYVASHDLKEPLRMINSYTKLLKRKYSDSFDESGNEFMFFIIDAVDRMETLLNDLLDFSRAGNKAAPQHFISSSDVMQIVEANLGHRLESLNAKLIVHHDRLPAIKAHQTQLIQLLQNLVSNGVKFKGEKDPEVTIDAKANEKGTIFSVKDNGIGISVENQKKVFEMFRRLHTRDEYEGTGIGLATCKKIVATWGGDIWVESVEGEGSTFFFSVPKNAVRVGLEKVV